MVTMPARRSTMSDICVESSFTKLALEVLGGLSTDDIFGICTAKEDAAATASTLLKMKRKGQIKVRATQHHAPVRIVGMPRTFWIVTMPTPTSQLRDICFHYGLERFLSYAKQDLSTQDVIGVYATKKDAVAAASRLLETMRQRGVVKVPKPWERGYSKYVGVPQSSGS